jgi:hypothetical protein
MRTGTGPPGRKRERRPQPEAAHLEIDNNSHWAYSQPIASLQAAAIVRLRRQRYIQKICRIPRLVAELLDEIGRHHGIAKDIDHRLARYAAIDPALLAAVGGDRFPHPPVHMVAR